MKVLALIAEQVGGTELAGLVSSALGEGFEASAASDVMSYEASHLDEAEVIVTALCPVNAEHIAAASKLKLIQCFSHGFDHVDVDAAAERGIPVCNLGASGAEDHNVAEHTFLLLLALAKRLVEGHTGLRLGRWVMPELRRAGLAELKGRTLGILGLGMIGRQVARRAKAFDMNVIYFDPVEIPEEVERESGAERRSLEDLLRESDAVTIHAPLTPSTRHLLNAKKLALMKQTAFLINTSRGAIVDSDALAEALNTGSIAGAGLDVFDPEPPQPDHALLRAPNVVLSPHVAGVTKESIDRILHEAVTNVRRYAAGEPLRDIVNGVSLGA